VTPTSLHYLPSDISEAKNVLEQNPSVAEALTEAAEVFDQSLKASRRPAGNLDAE
jgi:hypothetical protein